MRDRPVAEDESPKEEFIQAFEGRGVFVPFGMSAEEIMLGAKALEDRFDVPPYLSRAMVREVLSAVQGAKPSC